MKNKNHIGIVFGGYVDENNKLMDRMELNRRIASLQKQVSELTEEKVLEIIVKHSIEPKLESMSLNLLGKDFEVVAKEIIAVVKGE